MLEIMLFFLSYYLNKLGTAKANILVKSQMEINANFPNYNTVQTV